MSNKEDVNFANMSLDKLKEVINKAIKEMTDEEYDEYFPEEENWVCDPLLASQLKNAEFKYIISELLNKLPQNRDWLDPMLEKAMRSLVENN